MNDIVRMTPRIAIVGTGPTALYTLRHLIDSPRPLFVTLFEASDLAGTGLPYHPGHTKAPMLANIASVEIPPLTCTYLEWLQAQPEAILALHGTDRAALDARAFLPRLLLGGWFRDALEAMIAEGRARGHAIALREATPVTDVTPLDEGLRVTFATPSGPESQIFSHAVLAIGHAWPEDADDARHFVSPWSGLMRAEIPAGPVGILGTSLSAIDATLAVACQHGRFQGDTFQLAEGAEALRITLMSRQGLLPEADFWCPLPYEPLLRFTEASVAAEIAKGTDGLLDRLFTLFRFELMLADPEWEPAAELDIDGFAAAYFAPRQAADPFDHAEANLAEVERNAQSRSTVAWRYAILRMHEPMEAALPHLDAPDLARFEALKRVFIDNYAAIPPQSIRRLLALHRAGVLEVLRLGADYDRQDDAGGTHIRTASGTLRDFPVFIDARGQGRLRLKDLPFPGLRAALTPEPSGDVALEADFALKGQPGIYLPAAPFLLGRRPFSQGITVSAEMGETVAGALLARAYQQT